MPGFVTLPRVFIVFKERKKYATIYCAAIVDVSEISPTLTQGFELQIPTTSQNYDVVPRIDHFSIMLGYDISGTYLTFCAALYTM